jgi:hypothetical protein
MFEYIEFYTKNLSNFTVLLLLGLIIAILDITIRKVVKGVYLNVRENMRLKHGGGGQGKEGLTTKKKSGGDDDGDGDDGDGDGDGDDGDGGAGDGGGGGGGGGAGDDSCPKDCSAVDALRKRLTVLIENATKLQKDIKENNELIIDQQKTIENMKKAVQKLVQAGNKK